MRLDLVPSEPTLALAVAVIASFAFVRSFPCRLEGFRYDDSDNLTTCQMPVALQRRGWSAARRPKLRLDLTTDILVSEDVEHASNRPSRGRA